MGNPFSKCCLNTEQVEQKTHVHDRNNRTKRSGSRDSRNKNTGTGRRRNSGNKNSGTTIVSNKVKIGSVKVSIGKNAENITINHHGKNEQDKAERSTAKCTGNREERKTVFTSKYTKEAAANLTRRTFESVSAGNFIDNRNIHQREFVYVLQDLEKYSHSVCQIRFPGGTATGFRVGSKYIMTAKHVVTLILQSPFPRLGSHNHIDFDALQEGSVYCVFDYTRQHQPENERKYNFRALHHFMNDETDTAVLELADNSDGSPMPRPFELFGFPDLTGKRRTWGNHLEFILTMVGYAVGLGNIWRFPYLCYRNGGGAFLIPYFIALLVLGVPLFFMELCFGQFASRGPLKIWRRIPAMTGVGLSAVLISSCIVIYYNVIVAYCMFYFFASMTSKLPWMHCDNEWNTCQCRDAHMNLNATIPWSNGSRFVAECNSTDTANTTITTPSEEYFLRRVLRRNRGLEHKGNVLWDVSLCNLLAWTIIFLVLTKGVKTLGKVMYVASIFPYILLTILLVRGLTLDGHGIGIDFYIQPNMTKLSEASVWSDAAVQIFYSLGICLGGLIAMSSFNQFKTNTLRDAVLIPIINCLTSFCGGFVIFSVLGFMATQKKTTVADVVADGPGLTFVVYPEALSQMPVAPLWAVLFFLMMTMLGFSSQFSSTETVLSSIMDEFPAIRESKVREVGFRAGGCLLFFLLGLPMTTEGGFYLLNLVDYYIGGFPLLFAGIFEIIAVMLVHGVNNFKKDIELMLGKRLLTRAAFSFFIPMWILVTPLCLLSLIIFKSIQYKPLTLGSYDYPDFGDVIGWLAAAAPILVVPGWFIGYFCWKGRISTLKQTPRLTEVEESFL